jgi:hypothetical protein
MRIDGKITTDYLPRGSGLDSWIRYGFSVEVWLEDNSDWYSQAIGEKDGFNTSLELLFH